MDAFGDEDCGIWRPGDGRGDLAIPYRRRPLRVGPLRIPAAAAAANDHTPRFDSLGNRAPDASTLLRMMRELGVHCLVFPYLAPDARLLRAAMRGQGIACHRDLCEYSPYVDCSRPWDDYWQSLGRSSRATWGRRERRLVRDRDARLQVYSEWAAVAPLWERLLEIEASGWKGEMGTAIAQSPVTRQFYTRLAQALADAGRLRLFTLEIPAQGIIAFELTEFSDGVLYQLKVGYDQAWHKHSPGQALRVQLLRWAFAQPDVRAFDMLGGGGKAAAVKRKWATDATRLETLYLFRPSLPGRLAWLRYRVAPAWKARLLGR